jgi:hypothetical protein
MIISLRVIISPFESAKLKDRAESIGSERGASLPSHQDDRGATFSPLV